MPQLVDPMPCPLPAGAATLHDAYTPHYAGPNETDSDRRAVIIKAQIETLPTDAPQTFPWLEAWETARQKRAEQNA